MLKTLIKKQVYELFAFIFLGAARSKKSKKNSNTGKVFTAVLMFFVMAVVFILIFTLASAMALEMIPKDFAWLLFAFFGVPSLVSSLFINAFIACSMLFKSKDNNLLLSMPIPPRHILFSRMIVLFINCLVVTAIVWLPAVIVYQMFAGFQILPLIFGLLMMIIISMIAIAFACLIGWLIAILIRNKITKTILSIIGILILFGFILFGQIFTEGLIKQLLNDLDNVGQILITNAYPLYIFGKAACGDILAFVILLLVGIALFALIYFIMDKTFISVVSASKSSKKKIYKAQTQKMKKMSKSLLDKEWALLFKTPVYLINCGLGNVFLIAVIILGITQIQTLSQVLPMLIELSKSTNEFPFYILPDVIVFALAYVPIALTGFNTLTAPSISIEGKNIWVLKSLPLEPIEVFKSKINMQAIYSLIPSLIFIVIFGSLIKFDYLELLAVVVCVAAYCYLTAYFGICISIIRANLNWTNITIAVKQNLGVLFAIIFALIMPIIFIALYLITVAFCYYSVVFYLGGTILVYAFVIFLMDKWLKTKGTARFLEL